MAAFVSCSASGMIEEVYCDGSLVPASILSDSVCEDNEEMTICDTSSLTEDVIIGADIGNGTDWRPVAVGATLMAIIGFGISRIFKK